LADLITPVLISIFAGVMVVVGFAFYLIRRASRPSFEKGDYYESNRGREKYPYGGNPFKRPETPPEMKNQRVLIAIIAGLALFAVLISYLLDNIFEGLLVIFMLPVIVRFVRARQEIGKRRAENDENRPSY
jgi:hypothetical protein